MPSAILRAVHATLGGMPRTFWWLWGGTLVNKLGSFVVAFLAIYLTQERHFPVEQVGLIVALFGAGSVLASPAGGLLADRIGRRQTMVLGLVAGAAVMVALGLARSVAAISVATFALGLTSDLYRPAVSAAIADVVPPADRLRGFTLLYWAINLGFSVAAVAAGALVPFGYLALFLADAATSLLFALLILWKVPETRPSSAPRLHGESLFAGLTVPLRDPVFLPFFGLTIVVALVFLQFLSALPMEMGANGISTGEYGRVIAVNGVLIVTLQPLTARWLGKRRRARVLAAGAALTGVGYGFNVFAHTAPLYALSVAIWTLGEIVLSPANSSVVADLSPPELRGRYQGAVSLSWSFSMLAAPLLGSFVLAHGGRLWLWGGCAALGLAAAAGHLAIAPARRARVAQLLGPSARAD